jgi:CheY-like chemotaxis protein
MVESNPRALALMETALHDEGYSLFRAQTREEALSVLSSHRSASRTGPVRFALSP